MKALIFLLIINFSFKKVVYPQTKEIKVVDTIFGYIIEDPYRWLENVEDEEVKKWIKMQNKLTRSILDSLPQREELKKELYDILSRTTVSLPMVYGNKFFFYKREKEQNHSVLYVSENIFDIENAKVLIDPNKFSEDKTVSLDFVYPSLSGKYIVFGKSRGGSENSVIYIMDVESGRVFNDSIKDAKWASVAWTKDEKGFYYTRNVGGDKFIPWVFYHKLNTPYQKDEYIYGKGLKETETVDVEISKDGRILFLYVFKGWDKNDLYFKDLEKETDFIPLAKDIDAVFSAKYYDGYFYIRTNWNAPNYKLIRVKLEEPDINKAETVIKEGKGVLQNFSFAGKRLIYTVKENTFYRMFVATLDGKILYEIKTQEKGSIWFRIISYDNPEIFYAFVSFFRPTEIYKFNVLTKEKELIFKEKIDFDPSLYTQEFVFYESKDGTKVPMYILYKKGIKKDGNNPTILNGYGGFAAGISPYFRSSIIPWLKRGGIFAIAGIRGGNEYGEEWHKQGMRDKKQNVFDDFIAAAEYLIKEGYTSPSKLAISGGSNGGLLVGAVMVQRPDLFRAVYCAVPLLDMIRYHKFGVAHIWIPEYGNPDDPDDFKYLIKYSPYQNVKMGKKYPAVFFKTSEFDGRVHPMHAMKMAAKLQKIASEDRPVLLYVEPKAGHGKGKPLYKTIDSIADQYLFIMWQLGMLNN